MTPKKVTLTFRTYKLKSKGLVDETVLTTKNGAHRFVYVVDNEPGATLLAVRGASHYPAVQALAKLLGFEVQIRRYAKVVELLEGERALTREVHAQYEEQRLRASAAEYKLDLLQHSSPERAIGGTNRQKAVAAARAQVVTEERARGLRAFLRFCEGPEREKVLTAEGRADLEAAWWLYFEEVG